jgi:hypothetical protein
VRTLLIGKASTDVTLVADNRSAKNRYRITFMARSFNECYLALPDNVPDPEVAVELPPPHPAKAAAKRSVISNTNKFSLFLFFIVPSPCELTVTAEILPVT